MKYRVCSFERFATYSAVGIDNQPGGATAAIL
jgi:hypothetical protein